jgi:hypothetical protein
MSGHSTHATCDECGERVVVGGWPWCPHGPYGGTAIGDELVGGFAQENFSENVEIFYSKKAMLQRADELGLQPFVKHAGEHERHLVNWAAGATEKQLRDAAILLSRGRVETKTPAVCETLQTSVREFGTVVVTR